MMDNSIPVTDSEQNNTPREGVRSFIAQADLPPCIGRPRGCMVAGYVITQGHHHGKKPHQFENLVRPVPGDHGTFGVLVVILDTPAQEMFDLHVTYSVVGQESPIGAPFVVSGNTDDPESYRKIPIVTGAMTGLTAFRILRDVPPQRLLITVKHDDGTVLLEQTLSMLEENAEQEGSHRERPPIVETRYEHTGEALVIDQKIIIPR